MLRAMVQRTILRVIRSENDSPKKTPIEAKARRDEPRVGEVSVDRHEWKIYLLDPRERYEVKGLPMDPIGSHHYWGERGKAKEKYGMP